MQHFDNPQNQMPVTPSALVPAEQNDVFTSDPVFAALSQQGRRTVAEYLAHVERGLPGRDTGPGYYAFEQAETLHELQSHLLSLIVAYQELGDDERGAITAAIAQFGAARSVSGGLRRAKARNQVAHLLRKNDQLLPAVLLPAFFFNVSLLLAFLNTTTRYTGEGGSQMSHTTTVVLSWHVLLLLPFLCGAVNANVSKKWSLLGIFMGVAAVLGAFSVLEILFGGNPATLGAMETSLVPWLGSACLGIVSAHTAIAFTHRKRAA